MCLKSEGVAPAEFVRGGNEEAKEEEKEEKQLKIEENGKKMKEQRTGARRVSSRLQSSQVLYEGGNYRGRGGETGGGRRRETGGRKERERETYHCSNEERGSEKRWRER